jgi:transcriptional regulator with XRE-family HTH domain
MQLVFAERQVADRENVFDFEGFYRALTATRESRNLTWKQVGEETSVGASTLARMSQNRRPDADGLATLSAWSGLNPADFVQYTAKAPAAEPLAEISRVLRNDPHLQREDAEALEDIVRAAYARLVKKANTPENE